MSLRIFDQKVKGIGLAGFVTEGANEHLNFLDLEL
jgi:hypothetical protein